MHDIFHHKYCGNVLLMLVVMSVVVEGASLSLSISSSTKTVPNHHCLHVSTFLALVLLHLLNMVPACRSLVLAVLLHTKLAPKALAVVCMKMK